MANNLFPVESDSAAAVEATQDRTETGIYKESYYFDFDSGDFVRDELGKIKKCTGAESWQQWCLLAILTKRYAYLAYSSDYGTDYDEMFAGTSKEDTEMRIQQEILEALYADPYQRLSYASNFTFDWIDQTQVNISVTLYGVNGNSTDIATTLRLR